MPRLALGRRLAGVASSAIDVSDGLLGDLSHLLAASRVGARVDVDAATDLLAGGARLASAALDRGLLMRCALAGGDDYELVFTAAPARRAAVQQAGSDSATRVTRIGSIEAAPGLRLVDGQGHAVPGEFPAFDHFA